MKLEDLAMKKVLLAFVMTWCVGLLGTRHGGNQETEKEKRTESVRFDKSESVHACDCSNAWKNCHLLEASNRVYLLVVELEELVKAAELEDLH